MKINRYFPLACALALMGLTTAETEARSESPRTEPQAPYGSGSALDAPVESSFKYESFADARRLMEERTGLKAEANPDIAAFLEKLWIKRGEGDPRTEKKVPARQFLDAICQSLALQWRYDPAQKAIELDLAWRRPDTRSSAELLQVVMKDTAEAEMLPRTGEVRPPTKRESPDGGVIFSERLPKNTVWHDALDSLLSKPENFPIAWKARQQAQAEGLIGFTLMKPVVAQAVSTASGKRYVLVMTYQPISDYPGHGTLAYYWFTKDGKIAGAGLTTSGHRCDVTSVKVMDSASAKDPSTLQLDLMMNMDYPLIAQFQLSDTGLVRTFATGQSGSSSSDVGKSVLKE